jgi:phosphatidylglycerol:prolipoprotein diacylglycerol transferase
MKIAISDPGFYFAFFYFLSFLIPFVLIIFFTIRLKIPLWSVFLILTTVTFCTIVGSRLFTIPVSEWGQIITSGNFDGYRGRFAIGGLLFGLAGLIISQKIIGFGKPLLSLYAWIAPLGFGIQKIGCFFNGCCYGKVSGLPWSIQYPSGSSAHFHQLASGMIDEHAAYSLGVIPVQLIEVLCLFTISYIVWRSLRFWKMTGSALVFTLVLFFICRFCCEFFRDPAANDFDIISGSGFTNQLLFLALAIISLVILFLNEKLFKATDKKSFCVEPSFKRSFLFVLSLSILIYVFRGLFTPYEMLSLEIKFIPAVILTAYYVYKTIKTIGFQLATTSSFVLPLLLVISLKPDSTKSGSVINFYKNEVKSYKRVDIGFSPGEYYNTVRYNPHEGQCGTEYTSEDYKNIYRIAGAGFSVISKKGKSITTTGVNLYGGTNKEIKLLDQTEKTRFLAGVNPYIKYDIPWFGMGAGIHLGNLRWAAQSAIDETTFSGSTRYSPVMPEVYLRVGRPDYIDLKYTYGSSFPTSFPILLQEISLGSGFGIKTDFSFRVGEAFSKYDNFTFVSADFLLNKQLGLNLKYNFGGDDFYNSNTGENINRKGRILFGANYRFGFKK